MISRINTSYRSICDLFDFSKEKNSVVLKKQLINLAKNGSPRPQRDAKLGKALNYFTNKSSTSYDEIFTKTINDLAPQWFNQGKIKLIKAELLNLARSGLDKPIKKTHIGRWLWKFTTKTNNLYDDKFTKNIKKTRPDWFKIRKVRNTIEKNRNATFLNKFKMLTILMSRDRNEIYNKKELSYLYCGNRELKNIKAAQRLIECFEIAGLVLSCDEKGNTDARDKQKKSSKTRYWKLKEDIVEKLGLNLEERTQK